MRNVLIPELVSLDRIYATDLYLGSNTQKLAVIDNLCTGPFENIAHFKDPVFPLSDMLFDEAHLSSRSELVGEVLDTMQILRSNPQMLAAVSWNGWSRLGRS